MKSTILLLLLPAVWLVSCNNADDKGKSTLPSSSAAGDSALIKSLVEARIGESDYYISLPAGYTLKPNQGPDFSVYYFYPSDTTVRSALSGGIYFGNFPHLFAAENDSCKTEMVKGKIMGSETDWTVFSCRNEYLAQTIAENKGGEGWMQKIHAFGSASSREELNRIYLIYSTLEKK